MVDSINIGAYFLCTWMVGFIVMKLINPEMRLSAASFFLFYGLGAGVISLEMFFISLAGLKFSIGLILIPWSAPLFIILYRSRKVIKRHFNLKDCLTAVKYGIGSISPIPVIFFVLVVFPFFLEILAGLPFLGWDAWATWGFKAKIFYLEKHVPFNLYTDKLSIIPVKEYPLLVSLTEAFLYNFIGRFDDTVARGIFFAFYVCFLIYFYNLCKELYGKLQSYILTFLLATTPIFSSFACGYYNGYADLIFSYFNFISVTFLWSWMVKRDKSLFYLSGIFAGLALWTKVDGIVLLVANLICIFLIGFQGIKTKAMEFRLFFIYIVIVLIITGPWYFTVALLRFSSVHFSPGADFLPLFTDFKRWSMLIARFSQEALNFSTWNIFWIVFGLLSVVYLRKLFNRHYRLIFINTLLQLGLYVFIVFIDVDFYRAIVSSLSRLMFHLLPMILILIASALSQKDLKRECQPWHAYR